MKLLRIEARLDGLLVASGFARDGVFDPGYVLLKTEFLAALPLTLQQEDLDITVHPTEQREASTDQLAQALIDIMEGRSVEPHDPWNLSDEDFLAQCGIT